MDALVRKIRRRMESEGPLTFRTFMEMALYEPGLGYYARRETKMGREGDFYTSAHLHPAFGRMMGIQMEEMWSCLGSPALFTVVEMGAGEAFLAKDMLDSLRGSSFYRALSYVIVERNPWLAEGQEHLLKDHEGTVRWVSSLEEMDSVRGCVLSNELLDAFPVHLVEMRDGLSEVYVDAAPDGAFRETPGPPSTEAIAGYFERFSISLPRGYRTEVNLDMRAWLRGVARVLREGFLMSIDYGHTAQDYYSEERSRGTLLCYRRHRLSEDPYRNVGEQDMTAHVNFSALKAWAAEEGLGTLGYCRQGAYLVSLGIDKLIGALHEHAEDYEFQVARIKRLILPGTIGETHKVMVQYKGEARPVLRGFMLKNQVDTL
jgi:SAM-dependent MidA family methyltransferase